MDAWFSEDKSVPMATISLLIRSLYYVTVNCIMLWKVDFKNLSTVMFLLLRNHAHGAIIPRTQIRVSGTFKVSLKGNHCSECVQWSRIAHQFNFHTVIYPISLQFLLVLRKNVSESEKMRMTNWRQSWHSALKPAMLCISHWLHVHYPDWKH